MGLWTARGGMIPAGADNIQVVALAGALFIVLRSMKIMEHYQPTPLYEMKVRS
jgi:hypothetical protein